MLLAELRRIKNDGRKKLLDKWAPFLPSYVDPDLSLLSSSAGSHKEGEDDEDEDEEAILAGICMLSFRLVLQVFQLQHSL